MASPGRDGRTWDPSRLVARIRGQASHGMHTWSQVAMGVHGYSGGILLIHGPQKHTDVFKNRCERGRGRYSPPPLSTPHTRFPAFADFLT